MFDTIRKEATDAKITLKNVESTISTEERKKIEDNFKNKVESRKKAISDAEQKNDATQTEALTQTKKDFEEFKKDFSDEINNLLRTNQETVDATTQDNADKTNNFAKEVASNIGTYTTEELKSLTKRSWKELWTDPKYIKTIQQIIIDTGAKHNSISNEILTNGIYGRGTKAGIKTLQEYINMKYNMNLNTDGLAGPATLQALLMVDGEEKKTRLEKIIEDHKDIKPLEPDSIKSNTDKKKKIVGSKSKGKNNSITKTTTIEPDRNGGGKNIPEVKIENNKPKWIKSINELPKVLTRDKTKNNIRYVYIHTNGTQYEFYSNGKVAVFTDIKKNGKMYNSIDIINKLTKKPEKISNDKLDTIQSKIEKNINKYITNKKANVQKVTNNTDGTINIKYIFTDNKGQVHGQPGGEKCEEIILTGSKYITNDVFNEKLAIEDINKNIDTINKFYTLQNYLREKKRSAESIGLTKDDLGKVSVQTFLKALGISDGEFNKQEIKLDDIEEYNGSKSNIFFNFDTSFLNSRSKVNNNNKTTGYTLNIDKHFKNNKLDEESIRNSIKGFILKANEIF